MINASKQILPQAAKRATCYGSKDVWGIFTPLAQKHGAINLGQGFPNIPAPSFIKVRNPLLIIVIGSGLLGNQC